MGRELRTPHSILDLARTMGPPQESRMPPFLAIVRSPTKRMSPAPSQMTCGRVRLQAIYGGGAHHQCIATPRGAGDMHGSTYVLRRWVFNKLAVFLFCTYSYSVHAYIGFQGYPCLFLADRVHVCT